MFEQRALRCKPVQIGRANQIVTVRSDGIEALLIGHDEEEVGAGHAEIEFWTFEEDTGFGPGLEGEASAEPIGWDEVDS